MTRRFVPMDPMIAAISANLFGVDLPSPLPDPVGLVVGEMPGASTSPKMPMYPYPPGSAGGRLRHMSGIPIEVYLVRLERANLAHRHGRWYPGAAATVAGTILERLESDPLTAPEPGDGGPRVVLCGRRVADAFLAVVRHRMETIDDEPAWRRFRVGGVELATVPHPSGRNLLYNDVKVRRRAGEVVRWAARWTPEEES